MTEAGHITKGGLVPESFDVFLSYKREDQAFAEVLRERLIAWGYTVWMDVYNIPLGADWPLEIERGIAASQAVIGLMTPISVKSRNVQNEWEYGIVHGKRLIPVRLEPCDIPLNVTRINYVDFSQDREKGFAALRTALQQSDTPAITPADPFLPYLQALYDRINTYLAQTIIKVRPDDPRTPEPIQLRSERTCGAVDALFEKRDEIDPLFMIGGIKQEPVRLDDDFRKAFDYFDGRVLLLGEPGAGKTITLLHFGRDAVVQRIQNSAKPLPVLAIIPTWDAEKQTPIAEWLADSYGAPPDVARIVGDGRALLVLDGLDELGGKRKDLETEQQYDPRQGFMGIIPANNQVIVTCRVKDYEEIGEKIALKGAVTLQKLTDAQIQDYLSAEVPDLWVALDADKDLRDVARTPLLLSLLAFGYKDQGKEAAKLRDLQENPGELRDAVFGAYVRKRYEHEERKLKLRNPPEGLLFMLEDIYGVLGQIALLNFIGWEKKENVLPLGQFEGQLGSEQAPTFLEMATRLHLLVSIGKTTTYMSGEEKAYGFIHLLLRDHFAFGPLIGALFDPSIGSRHSDVARVLGELLTLT